MSKNEKDYSWIKRRNVFEEYVEAEYYNKILKDYIFDKKTDIELFSEWLDTINVKNSKILELGCGTGRVTEALLKKWSEYDELCLLDLSNQMLEYSKKKFSNKKKITFIQNDSLNYMLHSRKKFDIVYSLWSLSHSIHQNLDRLGLLEGEKYVITVLEKFFRNNIKKNGRFYLIHFDSLSDEQRILIKQWKREFKILEKSEEQSPSLQVIDKALTKLKEENIIKYKKKRLVGEKIIYSNIDEALEAFMNFHLESYFNDKPYTNDIIKDLKEYFKKFTNEKGEVLIKPGCLIYEVYKN